MAWNTTHFLKGTVIKGGAAQKGVGDLITPDSDNLRGGCFSDSIGGFNGAYWL